MRGRFGRGDARGGLSARVSDGLSPERPNPDESRPASGRIAVPFVQLEVHVEDVHELLADQAAPRRVGFRLKNALDILADVVDLELLVVRPLGRDAIELELGVLEA